MAASVGEPPGQRIGIKTMKQEPDLSLYWKTNVTYLTILLSIWFIVSYGCGMLFKDALNAVSIGGAPLGFWFAQQGSIYVFIILIFVVRPYLMNKLDAKYGVARGVKSDVSARLWTFLIVGITFIRSTSASRSGLVPARPKSSTWPVAAYLPLANGMATAADWMSAASFISMAGLISFLGYDGSACILMGWTGGYVLLALLLAPYLRKFGKFTVPDFVGDRYYSWHRAPRGRRLRYFRLLHLRGGPDARRGRGLQRASSRSTSTIGVVIGMVFGLLLRRTLGGMKGITYTQVAQYVRPHLRVTWSRRSSSPCMLTNNPIPQLGFIGNLGGDVGSQIANGYAISLLEKLNMLARGTRLRRVHRRVTRAPWSTSSSSPPPSWSAPPVCRTSSCASTLCPR